LLLVIVLGYFSLYGFSRGVRKKIKKDAEGCCQDCAENVGYEKLIAAHFNHKRGENYNKSNNGRALCIGCETHYHGQHVGRAWKIGLNEWQNLKAVEGGIGTIRKTDPELADYLQKLYLKSRRRRK
jgi:hypothetical protein